MKDLVKTSVSGVPVQIANLIERALETERKYEKSENTLRAYKSDINKFLVFVKEKKLEQRNPVESIVAFMNHLDDGKLWKANSIARMLSALKWFFGKQGYSDEKNPVSFPRIKNHMKAIRRKCAQDENRRPKSKPPILQTQLVVMVNGIENSLKGIRDRSMLLLAYSGYLRRSELVRIKLEDLIFDNEFLQIFIPTSKTDQTGKGEYVGILPGDHEITCPIRNLKLWIEAAEITSGYLYRKLDKYGHIKDGRVSGQAFDMVIQRICKKLNISERTFSPHSLRSGGATQASRNNSDINSIQKHGRWKDLRMPLHYIKRGNIFQNNPSGNLGL